MKKLRKLQTIFRTRNEVILLPIPGQLAIEMAVANFVGKAEHAFVCVNGFFSEAITSMVEYWGGEPIVIQAGLGSPVKPENVKQFLDAERDPAGKPLFIVHNETSTGVVNPVGDILKLCHDKGVITVLDSISAFGGIDVRVDDWKADYTIGYGSKALGGVYGVVPVSVSESAWRTARSRRDRIHSRYLNLNTWRKAIDVDGSWGHPYPSSMPTSIIVALRRAAELVLEEGLRNRYHRHEQAAAFLRNGLEALGLDIFPDKDYLSNTVSVARVNPKWEKRLRQQLLQKYDIMISGSDGELEGRIVRIGHMGTSANIPRLAITLNAISSILRDVRN